MNLTFPFPKRPVGFLECWKLSCMMAHLWKSPLSFGSRAMAYSRVRHDTSLPINIFSLALKQHALRVFGSC